MGESRILNDIKARKTADSEAKVAKNNYYRETYGMDELEDCDVLFFEKQYDDEGKIYPYVALRGGGFWYLTGREGKLSWFELLEEAERENLLPINIFRFTEMEPYLTEEDAEEAEERFAESNPDRYDVGY